MRTALRQRCQRDNRSQPQVRKRPRLDQPPHEAEIEERAQVAGDGLMHLSHGQVEHGRDEEHDTDPTGDRADKRLFIALVERIQPAEFPGKQHQQAAPAGE